jgi:hypothetical protein
MSWNQLERSGLFYPGFEKVTIPIFLGFAVTIETVHQSDPETALPQKAGDTKKAEGFDPEIEG